MRRIDGNAGRILLQILGQIILPLPRQILLRVDLDIGRHLADRGAQSRQQCGADDFNSGQFERFGGIAHGRVFGRPGGVLVAGLRQGWVHACETGADGDRHGAPAAIELVISHVMPPLFLNHRWRRSIACVPGGSITYKHGARLALVQQIAWACAEFSTHADRIMIFMSSNHAVITKKTFGRAMLSFAKTSP